MKNTILAKQGYIVKVRKSDPTQVAIFDGDDFLFTAERRSYEDYREEVIDEGNEMAHVCEVFTTIHGNKFVYWRDEEADWDLITKLN